MLYCFGDPAPVGDRTNYLFSSRLSQFSSEYHQAAQEAMQRGGGATVDRDIVIRAHKNPDIVAWVRQSNLPVFVDAESTYDLVTTRKCIEQIASDNPQLRRGCSIPILPYGPDDRGRWGGYPAMQTDYLAAAKDHFGQHPLCRLYKSWQPVAAMLDWIVTAGNVTKTTSFDADMIRLDSEIVLVNRYFGVRPMIYIWGRSTFDTNVPFTDDIKSKYLAHLLKYKKLYDFVIWDPDPVRDQWLINPLQ